MAGMQELAPRLWRAQGQVKALRRELELADRERDDEIEHLKRLVIHRELQFLRGRDRWYIAERARKLKEAKRTLARYEKRRKQEIKKRPGYLR